MATTHNVFVNKKKQMDTASICSHLLDAWLPCCDCKLFLNLKKKGFGWTKIGNNAVFHAFMETTQFWSRNQADQSGPKSFILARFYLLWCRSREKCLQCRNTKNCNNAFILTRQYSVGTGYLTIFISLGLYYCCSCVCFLNLEKKGFEKAKIGNNATYS